MDVDVDVDTCRSPHDEDDAAFSAWLVAPPLHTNLDSAASQNSNCSWWYSFAAIATNRTMYGWSVVHFPPNNDREDYRQRCLRRISAGKVPEKQDKMDRRCRGPHPHPSSPRPVMPQTAGRVPVPLIFCWLPRLRHPPPRRRRRRRHLNVSRRRRCRLFGLRTNWASVAAAAAAFGMSVARGANAAQPAVVDLRMASDKKRNGENWQAPPPHHRRRRFPMSLTVVPVILRLRIE